ncbi:MAG: hypothetical protein KBT27_01540 [Prevotellaceae bacterium]|nr:hypothetical protein [Candidatus Faecinaster equi]
MNDNNYLKFFTLLGFLCFAAVSCWATAESLHLLLSSWPTMFCWAITIGFFFIASWGTKMIADSLNQNVFMEKRGTNFIVGVIIVIIFWLFCSMPTNTHTFFYRNLIDEKVTSDIATTKGYLTQIKDNVSIDAKIQAKCAEVENKIHTKLQSLEAEIKNPLNPGNGPETEKILGEIAQILGVAKINKLSDKGVTQHDRIVLYQAYREVILMQLKNRKINIAKEIAPTNDNYKKVAKKELDNLQLMSECINRGQLSLTNADDVKKICNELNTSYATIKTYQQFVDFKNDSDKKNYTADNSQTKVSRLLSVYDVWVDFIAGKFGGLSFIFWIIISILVDVAAFIFFDITFKKDE